MVLTAKGDLGQVVHIGIAFAALVEEEAGARIEGARMVAGAEGLAGAGATGAVPALVDGGTEAWHDGDSGNGKGRRWATLFLVICAGQNFP